ncbi:MAG: membrane protein insertase YidC [Bdellovibrionales bacterium]|nr:membrane protein insertase YidC [Bdellovibrionales bacterium]
MAGKTWIAVVLCFLVWYGYLKWFAPKPPVEAPTTEATGEMVSPEGTASLPSLPADGLFSGRVLQAFQTAVADPALKLESPSVQAEFQKVGGNIHSIVLPNYHETVKDTSPLVAPVSETKTPFSLATLFSDPSLKEFEVSPYAGSVESGTLVMTHKATSGLSVTKTYRLDEKAYFGSMEIQIRFPEKSGKSDWGQLVIPLGGTGLEFKAQEPLNAWEAVAYQSDSVTRHHISDLEAAEEQKGNTGWIAFGNRYFTTVAANESEINPDVVFQGGEAFKGAYLRYPLKLKAGQNSLSFRVRLYTGPKDLNNLKEIAGLSKLVDYGMFSVVAVSLQKKLKFFYNFVKNYGVAIILLTLLVRGLFYPLTQKSMRSMKAMQKLQPQINALKEKYKDDRERLNREQMALFKTHKVNPAAGCLPILIQLPVFIALYQVLANSMELFHQPFFGWVMDLSAKDPFYIYPILMGVAMFFQQRMTPSAGMEPMQQKMMMFMPIVFTFFMINLPSGLTLYIFVSTLLGMAQQLYTNRETPSPAAAVVDSPSTEKG